MTLYRTQLKQAQGGGDWVNLIKYSNIFYFEAASSLDAANRGVELWALLKTSMREHCYCSSVYATDLTVGTTDYAEVPVPTGSQRATRVTGSGQQAYNPALCMRVDMTIQSSRPSRKFIRGGWIEGDVLNGGSQFDASVNGWSNASWSAILTEFGDDMRDVDGQALIGAIVLGGTIRRLGRDARSDVPIPPALG